MKSHTQLKKSWDKEKLRHLISEVYSAHEEPHSSSAVIDQTTDFLDDLHHSTLESERKQIEKEIRKSKRLINTFQAEMTTETTDGSKGETFLALPKLMTNQIIDTLLSHKKETKKKSWRSGIFNIYESY